jgi:hypothetical protein
MYCSHTVSHQHTISVDYTTPGLPQPDAYQDKHSLDTACKQRVCALSCRSRGSNTTLIHQPCLPSRLCWPSAASGGSAAVQPQPQPQQQVTMAQVVPGPCLIDNLVDATNTQRKHPTIRQPVITCSLHFRLTQAKNLAHRQLGSTRACVCDPQPPAGIMRRPHGTWPQNGTSHCQYTKTWLIQPHAVYTRQTQNSHTHPLKQKLSASHSQQWSTVCAAHARQAAVGHL